MKTTQELIDGFSKALEPFGFYLLKISKNPTWVNAKIQNGIEVSAGDIKTFKIEMGERKYDAEMESVTKKAINEVFYKKEEQKKEPEKEVKTETLPVVKKETVGILPDFFTEELMDKWKKLSGIKRLLDV